MLGPDDVKRFPWEQVKAYFGRPTLTWANADGTPGPTEKRLKAVAYLSPQGSARLFEGSSITFAQAVEAGRKGVPGGAALAATLTLTSATSHKRVSSPNVVGVLKGSDPALSATSVVLTAHLDHTGVRPSGDGDRINNGAYDNATGSAILLEVARALAGQPVRPKRSVVVVLVTAEEKGLLGSDYFAHYPVKAAGRMVANVNLDMPVFLAASSDIVAFGSENSTLEAVVRKAVAECRLHVEPRPDARGEHLRPQRPVLVGQAGHAGGVPDAGFHREGPGGERAGGVGGSSRRTTTSRATTCRCRWTCRRWSDSRAPTSPSPGRSPTTRSSRRGSPGTSLGRCSAARSDRHGASHDAITRQRHRAEAVRRHVDARHLRACTRSGVALGIATSAFIVTSFLFGLPSILAVILNYVKRGDVRGTFLGIALPLADPHLLVRPALDRRRLRWCRCRSCSCSSAS